MLKKPAKPATAPYSPSLSPPEMYSQYANRLKEVEDGAKIVFKAIQRNQGATTRQIAESIGWTRISVQSILINLLCAGLIRQEGNVENALLFAVDIKPPKQPKQSDQSESQSEQPLEQPESQSEQPESQSEQPLEQPESQSEQPESQSEQPLEQPESQSEQPESEQPLEQSRNSRWRDSDKKKVFDPRHMSLNARQVEEAQKTELAETEKE